MNAALLYGMIDLGSALMAYNIYRYIRFARDIQQQGSWETEVRILRVPIVLLVLFLIGYLAVALFGSPDYVMVAILFGGSIFVFLMILFIERITKRVKENERLEAQLQMAEESSRAKTSFLSSMSHEIRTPMNAIIGLNTLAMGDPDLSPTTREQLRQVDVSAKHLLELINDILDMSRIESGKMELSEETFSMPELLEQVDVIVAGQCRDKQLEYRRETIGVLGEAFVGDAMKLKQMLINVLGNSVKFTEAPGTVSFMVEQRQPTHDGCTLRFVMADTGVGMDEEFLPHLFDAFSQEDATMTTSYGGSGLGMAITKRIVDMMGGEVHVASKKGEGTTFTVDIPLRFGDEADLQKESPECAYMASGATQFDDVRILIVEDVDINAEIMQHLLEARGVASQRAENGQVAVDTFAASAEGYFSAILMDVRMPVMDGLAATRAIRALDRPDAQRIPIVAMTANAFEDDVRRSLEAGMNAHLTKPVEPEKLYYTLCTLVHE